MLDKIAFLLYNVSKFKFKRLDVMEVIKGACQYDVVCNNCGSYNCGTYGCADIYEDACTGCNED